MNDDIFGEPISVYSQAQAIADGVLLLLTRIGDVPIVATSNAFHTLGMENQIKAVAIIREGLLALQKPDDEDSEYMRLRVLYDRGTKYWVIHNGEGVTVLLPEDY